MRVNRLGEIVAPARMGRGFRWLLGSAWTSNLGDGLALAAGPLLVASQTQSPFLVALAALLQKLPWLLFGLYAGVLADRFDRRVMVVVSDLLRVGVVAVLCLAITTGWVDIRVVLVAMFLSGVAEVFADSATMTLLPMLVAKRDLGIGSARLSTSWLAMNQLVGPPLGALLFAMGSVWPFLAQVVCGLAAVAMIGRLRLPAPDPADSADRDSVLDDLKEGFGFAWRTPAVRTLVAATLLFNIMLGAAWAVLVLYATHRLEVDGVGFGLLMSALAVGGIVGTLSYDWLDRHVDVSVLLRVGLVLETLTHLGCALTQQLWVAMAMFFVMGAHSFVWGAASSAVRMRLVPTGLQGRVGSLYFVGMYGTMALGQLLGGGLASAFGLAAPFWFAFVGCSVVLVLLWRPMGAVGSSDKAHEPAVALA